MATESEDFGSLEGILLSRVERFEEGDNDICRKLYELHKDAVCSKVEEEDLQCQRILRFSSGWWGADPKSAFEGKGKTMKLAKFRQTLVLKTMEWFNLSDSMLELNDKIEGPGIFVFQHKAIPCLRYASQSSFVVNSVQCLILGALAGTAEFSPIVAAFLCSQARDWDFFFRFHGDLQMLDHHENEVVLEHNSLWPCGLNMQLNLTPATLPEIRRLCLKHAWPPADESFHATTPDSGRERETFKAKPIPLEDLTYTMFKRFIIELKEKTLERFDNEVNAFHDVTKTLKSRFNSFDDEDADNLDYACALFKEMLDRRDKSRRLAMKRDLCLKSGWWGLNVDTAIYPFGDKYFQLPMLMKILAEKATKWHPDSETQHTLAKKMHEPGVYVFQHKTVPHFRYVGQSDNVLGTVRVLVYRSLVGCCDFYLLAALLMSTTADDWYFYFVTAEDPLERDVKHNDLIIRHDALWPNGLNRDFVMNAETLPHFRKSCLRHKWPKQRDNNTILPLPSLVASDNDIIALSRSETPASGVAQVIDQVNAEQDGDELTSRGQSRSSAPRSSGSAGSFTPEMSTPDSRFPAAEFEELQMSAQPLVA
ncbi:uncharacterized protein LOC135487216 [Lineus longissimus]|uniref:uncharacterized protein LOC135487216 n=1 Tax=Lineus longissimus TaxID=88925 RepID=UPI00315DDDF9